MFEGSINFADTTPSYSSSINSLLQSLDQNSLLRNTKSTEWLIPLGRYLRNRLVAIGIYHEAST